MDSCPDTIMLGFTVHLEGPSFVIIYVCICMTVFNILFLTLTIVVPCLKSEVMQGSDYECYRTKTYPPYLCYIINPKEETVSSNNF